MTDTPVPPPQEPTQQQQMSYSQESQLPQQSMPFQPLLQEPQTIRSPMLPPPPPPMSLPAQQQFVPPPPPLSLQAQHQFMPLPPTQQVTSPLIPPMPPQQQTQQSTVVLSPPPQSLTMQQLRQRYTEEQVRLYFFPYPSHPIKELREKLLRWSLAAIGLGLLTVLMWRWVGTRPGVTTNELLIVACIIAMGVWIGWIIIKRIIPIWKELKEEQAQYDKEQAHLRRNPPPTQEAYEQWINEMRDRAYEDAPRKLHLSLTDTYKKWEEHRQNGASNEQSPNQWAFEADLQLSGFISPSEESLYGDPPVSKWADGLYKRHYSHNEFTRLFVTKNFVASYKTIVNTRNRSIEYEEIEHFYHHHLTHMMLNVTSKIITPVYMSALEPDFEPVVKNHTLSLVLDNGHTIEFDIASAKIYYGNDAYGRNKKITGVDDVHGVLLEVLVDHKMSGIGTIIEARTVPENV